MTESKLTCAEVAVERTRRMGKIRKHQLAIAGLQDRCLHDQTREERDYQDPKPYRVCLGCGKGFV